MDPEIDADAAGGRPRAAKAAVVAGIGSVAGPRAWRLGPGREGRRAAAALSDAAVAGVVLAGGTGLVRTDGRGSTGWWRGGQS
jgi:hypothetical protein